ncbi:MAG: hypothetical protein ACHQ52_15060 [Candidatus Eisenbacteria bacterium]
MSRDVAHPVTLATWAVLMVPLAGLLLLLGGWLVDRSRPWEPARWRTEGFVLVRGRTDPGYHGERWVVAIQPDCPHCMAEAPLLADSGHRLGVRVAALVVDSGRAPDLARLGALRVDELWWDAGDVWRRRWGHRLYGELMRFDSIGRLVDDGAPPPRTPRGDAPRPRAPRGDAPSPRDEGR